MSTDADEWDRAYRQLQKIDPQLESESEDDFIYAVFGAIVMVVTVGVTLLMILFGARLLGVA